MRISRSGFLIPPMLGLVTALAVSSCGDSTEPRIQPTILLMNPRGVSVDASLVTVSIYGQNFGADATVYWNGEERPTLREAWTSNHVHAIPTQADLASPGTAKITVSSNGRMSRPATFIIGEYLKPEMALTSVTPARGIAGAGPVEVTVTGSGFIPGMALFVPGTALEVTLLSSSTLRAMMPGFDRPQAVALDVGVPGVWSANASFSWQVDPAAPVISGLSPATVRAGGSEALHVRVLGSGFTSASVVWVNGVEQGTSFWDETELGIRLFPDQMASAGTLAITVVTPAQGGGRLRPSISS
jgi:hypothetical protein